MTFYFSSFFIHVIQAVPHTKYRRASVFFRFLLLPSDSGSGVMLRSFCQFAIG